MFLIPIISFFTFKIFNIFSSNKNSTSLNSNENSISAALCLDAHRRTPLFNAIQNGHLKSVEALVSSSDDVDLTLTDLNGNTVYHVCAETNNFEAMRYLLTRKDIKYQQALCIKNLNQDHVVHTACAHGNLEIIRLVLTKINEDFLVSTKAYLSQVNSQGYTCFHIACIKGYFNIIEYFLKDLKMRFFLRQVDVNGKNTCLHLAAANNHLSLVALLLKYDGADEVMRRAKNGNENTALEVSFQRGYFDIIKLLVNANTNATIQEDTRREFPLHVAANEGNYEVIQLLLDKGMPINTLNREGKNCLDIAIEMDKREVNFVHKIAFFGLSSLLILHLRRISASEKIGNSSSREFFIFFLDRLKFLKSSCR